MRATTKLFWMGAATLCAVEGCAPTEAPMACPDARIVFEAESVGVNLLFVLDRSGSMHLEVPSGASRWSATKAALFEMFDHLEDRANGAITMFPNGDAPLSCCPAANPNCGACGLDDVPTPEVRCAFDSYDEATFALMTPATIDAMKAEVSASDGQHYWGTPLAAAMTGAEQAVLANDNGWQSAIVLLTDGRPAACATDDNPGADDIQLALRATDSATKAGVKTYVVGVIDGNQAADAAHMSALALAGGSARYEGCEAKDDCAYSVDIDTFAEDVKAALAEIAQQTISCTFSLGDHGLEEAPSVQLTSPGGSTDIAFDTSHDNGWDWLSYDQIKLYGDACEQFKATPSAKVQVMAGCADARR